MKILKDKDGIYKIFSNKITSKLEPPPQDTVMIPSNLDVRNFPSLDKLCEKYGISQDQIEVEDRSLKPVGKELPPLSDAEITSFLEPEEREAFSKTPLPPQQTILLNNFYEYKLKMMEMITEILLTKNKKERIVRLAFAKGYIQAYKEIDAQIGEQLENFFNEKVIE